MYKQLAIIMAMVRGILEMLQMASGNELKSFNDFARISIKGKRLSSATVSKRLKELIYAKTLEEVITKSKNGRRVIAYRTTAKGKSAITLANELEAILILPNTR